MLFLFNCFIEIHIHHFMVFFCYFDQVLWKLVFKNLHIQNCIKTERTAARRFRAVNCNVKLCLLNKLESEYQAPCRAASWKPTGGHYFHYISHWHRGEVAVSYFVMCINNHQNLQLQSVSFESKLTDLVDYDCSHWCHIQQQAVFAFR